MHTDFACLFYKYIVNKLPISKIHLIVSEAVKIENQFVSESLPVDLIGMNSTLMCRYIEFCADRLLYALGAPKIYQV